MTDPNDPARVRHQPAIRRPRPRVWLLCGAGLGIVAVALFLLNLPATPALSWIGIAFEVAFFAALAVSALAVRSDRYRGKNLAVCLVGMAVVAVVLLTAILIVRVSGGV